MDIKKIVKSVSRRKSTITIICVWTILVALIVIKAYWLSYSTRNRLKYYKPIYPGYDLSGADCLDLLIIGVAGLMVGLFLNDVKEMIYGYIATMLSVFLVSVIYISIYIWYVLDFRTIFSLNPFEWELAVYTAASIAFALMVPWIIGICLVSLVIGAFLRTWMGWS